MAALNGANDRAEREAADWFAKLNNRAITTAALEAFYVWRREPTHDAAYSRIEALWETSGRLRAAPQTGQDVAAALARGARRRAWRTGLKTLVLPIGGLALVGAAALYVAELANTTVYRTPVGAQRLVALADGTRVRLDTDTALKIRLREHSREVRLLQGQAFFDVAHDASRPFVVQADGAQVRALGTRFDVRLQGGQPRVTLVEGAVEVTDPRAGQVRRWRLRPGEGLAPRAPAARPATVDVAATTSWTSGHLVFHALPLSEAVAEVNRYSRTKLVLEAPALAGSPVNGVFDVGDTRAFAAAVCDLFDLAAAPPQDGEIRLRPKG